MNVPKKLESLAYALLFAVFLYVAVAYAVFELRHPWTTESERRVWFWSALKFKQVSYWEMRPR